MIVITSDKADGDQFMCMKLLDIGVSYIHVRKPMLTELELGKWLDRIEEEYWSKLVLHNHHELSSEYVGIEKHVKPTQRRIEDFPAHSTGVHSKEGLLYYSARCKYVFCSPVFDSVSKKGYKSNKIWQQHVQHAKAIALGGITFNHIEQIKDWGYQDFAALGSVWESTDPLGYSAKMIEKWDALGQTY